MGIFQLFGVVCLQNTHTSEAQSLVDSAIIRNKKKKIKKKLTTKLFPFFFLFLMIYFWNGKFAENKNTSFVNTYSPNVQCGRPRWTRSKKKAETFSFFFFFVFFFFKYVSFFYLQRFFWDGEDAIASQIALEKVQKKRRPFFFFFFLNEQHPQPCKHSTNDTRICTLRGERKVRAFYIYI